MVAVEADGSYRSFLTDRGVPEAQKIIASGRIISEHRAKSPSEDPEKFDEGFEALLKLDDICEAEAAPVRVMEDIFTLGYLAGLKAVNPTPPPKKFKTRPLRP